MHMQLQGHIKTRAQSVPADSCSHRLETPHPHQRLLLLLLERKEENKLRDAQAQNA